MTRFPLLRPKALAVAASLGLAAAGTVAGAHAQGWHHDRNGDGDAFAVMRGLDLTSQQKGQIHALLGAEHAATASARNQLNDIRQQIETALYSTGTVSTATVMPLLQQEEQIRASLDQAKLATALQIRGVLSASQLQQAASLHAQLASLHEQEHALMHDGNANAPSGPN